MITPSSMDSAPELTMRWFAPLAVPIYSVKSTTSTNDLAPQLLRTSDVETPHFTTITALTQTAGRGRLGRHWVSFPNRSLLASTLISLPDIPTMNHAAPWALIASTLAARQIIASRLEQHGHSVTVKWPNDIFIDEKRKISGLLGEALGVLDSCTWCVIGWGLNVSMTKKELPTPIATALSLEGDIRAKDNPAESIRILLDEYLLAFNERVNLLIKSDGNADKSGLLAEMRTHCSSVNQPLDVYPPNISSPSHIMPAADSSHNQKTSETNHTHVYPAGSSYVTKPVKDTPIRAIARNIDKNGALIIELPDHSLQTVTAGDVEIIAPLKTL